MNTNNDELQKAIERLNDSIVLPHLSQRGKDLELVLSAAKQLSVVQRENGELKEQLEQALNPLHSCSSDCKRPACVFRRECDSLKQENERMREALMKCFTHLGNEIIRTPLNESAENGTQRLAREVSNLLDTLSTPLTNAENRKM
jgi:hypothetical protein